MAAQIDRLVLKWSDNVKAKDALYSEARLKRCPLWGFPDGVTEFEWFWIKRLHKVHLSEHPEIRCECSK